MPKGREGTKTAKACTAVLPCMVVHAHIHTTCILYEGTLGEKSSKVDGSNHFVVEAEDALCLRKYVHIPTPFSRVIDICLERVETQPHLQPSKLSFANRPEVPGMFLASSQKTFASRMQELNHECVLGLLHDQVGFSPYGRHRHRVVQDRPSYGYFPHKETSRHGKNIACHDVT
jgi:hypothetical protein